MSDQPNHEAAAAVLAALGPKTLAGLIIDMVAPAGANSSWDSEMIELVLQPLEDVFDLLKLPWVGSAEIEGAHKFWAAIAEEIGVETDYEEPEVCAEDGCENPLDDGEGYDGYCGTHADEREEAGVFDERP